MVNPFKIVRVRELPETPESNTMYIIRPSDGEYVDVVFVGLDPTESARVVSISDVTNYVHNAIEQSMQDSAEVYVVPTIQAMWALTIQRNAIAYVQDTSGDEFATSSKGVYVYSLADGLWLPLPSEARGVATWNDIEGRPTSAPADIDAAVAATHSHSNLPTLERISDVNGKLAYQGQVVSDVSVVATW